MCLKIATLLYIIPLNLCSKSYMSVGYRVVPQYLNEFIIFQSDYLIVLARTYLNPEIKAKVIGIIGLLY